MPCVCKLKVDRTQSKVQCAGCKELFHLKCVGILQSDLDFLIASNKPFLCNACTAERRASRASSPAVNFNETASSNMYSESQKQKPIVNSTAQDNYQTVVKELKAMRAENARVLSLLSTIFNDNKQLSNKSDAIYAEIQLLQTNLHSKDAITSSLTFELKDLRCVVSDLHKQRGG